MQIKLSIIVTTYNWPEALKLVLAALASQMASNMEIIIADDGSGLETKSVIDAAKNNSLCSIHHIWQPDEGFQAAKIRNKAIAQAKGEYIIFIDGDCIIAKNFIKNHLALKKANYFVAGNRVLLTELFTQDLLSQNKSIYLHHWTIKDWIIARWKNKINRLLPIIQSKILLKMVELFSKQKWQGAKTCNLAAWKKDLLSVNGFDESFTGWGFEDSDLIVRLLKKGIMRKEARFYASVIHLWHPEQSRDKLKANCQKLQKVIHSADFFSKLGLDQYEV